MSQHSKILAVLTLGVTLAVSGLAAARHVVAVAGEASAERLNRAILQYVAQRNPQAPIKAFQRFPEVLMEEAQRTQIDHCLALAQADYESEFRHDAVGAAGEIGLFQILPTTAAIFEPALGAIQHPALNKAKRELGDLADPTVNTRFAMAYLRDIMRRKPNLRDALIEYNGGPAGRHPQYYRGVMGAYVELLEHRELRCRFQPAPKHPAVLALLARM